jgi:hypothetical protein
MLNFLIRYLESHRIQEYDLEPDPDPYQNMTDPGYPGTGSWLVTDTYPPDA